MCLTTRATVKQATLEQHVTFQVTVYALMCIAKFLSFFFLAVYEDTCAVDICVNGGTCKELAGDTVCLCPPFYIGVTCSLRE